MRAIVKRPLSKNILAGLSITLFVVSSVGLYKSVTPHYAVRSQILGTDSQKVSAGLPVSLIIPVLNIRTGIQYLGVTPDEKMDVPSNSTDVGWFVLGPRPGENGNSVIAGHLDGKNGEVGVFSELNKLKGGDAILIEDDRGSTIPFVVRESRIYDPGYADEIFAPSDSPQLNLVTCEGVWDKNTKSYTKRLVVFADINNKNIPVKYPETIEP